MSALFDAKNFGFFEIYGVRRDKRGGVQPVRTRGRGQFFAILGGRPLWTAPNKHTNQNCKMRKLLSSSRNIALL